MARAATRSQRPAPSQSRRSRRSPSMESEGGEDDLMVGNGMDEDEDEGDEPSMVKDVQQKSNSLVRLALFSEHKRVPMRRDDVIKKILATQPRLFNNVFALAQVKLRETFGMEMVELPSRAALEQEANEPAATQEDELAEARRMTGMRKKSAALGSKTYILRSCLNPLLIAHAAQTNEALYELEAQEMPDTDEEDLNDEEDDGRLRHYGSIISWSTSDHLGPIGILYVILALILVNGRVLGDGDLRAQLRRLGLPSTPNNAPVYFNSTATRRDMSLDDYLSQLQRQGFLERQVVGETGAGKNKNKGKGRQKRVRQTADDDGGGEAWEWRWGARAQCEVGEVDIAQFIGEFMIGDGGGSDEEEEEGDEAHRRGAEGRLKKMLVGIEKAAGGSLAGIK